MKQNRIVPGTLWQATQEAFPLFYSGTLKDQKLIENRLIRTPIAPGTICLAVGVFEYQHFPNWFGVLFLCDDQLLISTEEFFHCGFKAV